jgi:IS5 family transposase
MMYDMPTLRHFARLSSLDAIPDETTILNFRRLIEEYELAPEIFGCVVTLPYHGWLHHETLARVSA